LINPEPASEDEEPKSFLVKMLEDIATVQIGESSIAPVKVANPKNVCEIAVLSSKF
jgi:hypothetical protein